MNRDKTEGAAFYAPLPADPVALREALGAFLTPRRKLHTLGVEDRAATLALRYGADVTEARQAALLHDITKDRGNQLKLLKEYGILKQAEDLPREVLHAVTAAAAAKGLGMSGNVQSAIRWHTTARPQMSKLDAIIYLADMVEPFRPRKSDRVELWRLCLCDLDAALHRGLTLSLTYLKKGGKRIDPCTRQALDYIKI